MRGIEQATHQLNVIFQVREGTWKGEEEQVLNFAVTVEEWRNHQ